MVPLAWRPHHFQFHQLMTRFTAVSAALAAATLLSACVFAPPINTPTDTQAVTRMSDEPLPRYNNPCEIG